MTKIIESFAGNTHEVEKLRKQINTALKTGPVKVHLWQPGIMYEIKHPYPEWLTVVDFMNEWQGKPVSFFSNMVPLKKIHVEYNYVNDMFFEGNQLYEKNELCKKLLSKLLPITPDRRYRFDFLFGRKNYIKENLFAKFLTHPVSENTFFTYYRKDIEKGYWSHHVITPELNSAESITTYRKRFETKLRCSDLIDPEIYNQTYYSAVIETVIHNDFAMFSEKEAKPIMAQRPFVIFGAKHQLQAFRSLGFKSFHPVIDESYDQIDDIEQRFLAVLDAMDNLCSKDPLFVYGELKDVLEHNKKHLLEHKWIRL